MKRGQTNLNFLICIDKPNSMTSHDVVNRVRNITGEGRVGHMGTLDPLATGVMLIGVGSAARLNNYLELSDKTYEVCAEFGKTTNTYDCQGEVTSKHDVDPDYMTEKFASDYLNKLVGKHMQVPPAFSAIKIDGKPAYKSARSGEDVNLEPREIDIYSAELIGVSENKWKFSLEVSKGTYIRSIVHEIGQDLGCGAHVCELSRSSVGCVNLGDCYSLDELQKGFENKNLRVLNAAEILSFPIVDADEKMMKRVSNGSSLRNNSE